MSRQNYTEGRKIDWTRVDNVIRQYLGIGYHLVGVKISTRIGNVDESKPYKSLRYCQMVREAAQKGQTFLATINDISCPNAHYALGFRKPRFFDFKPRIEPAQTKALLIKPLSKWKEEPDVILAILTPKQMMDLTIILMAEENKPIQGVFKGQASVCGEATAVPYMTKRPNLSVLCNGSRMFAEFREDELIFGAVPQIYVKAAATIERMVKTGGALCGCRTSDLPIEIVEEFDKIGFSKGTDYFFGKIDDRMVRIYLNKDFRGRYKFITVHLPIKLSSSKEAEEVKKKLDMIIRKPYHVSQRGPWLDLSMMASADELGVNLLTGENLETTVKGVFSLLIRYLNRI